MLPAKPDSLRVALNRVTFGARDLDVASVATSGWASWVESQLTAPPGDDPQLAAHLNAQVMRIQYAAPGTAFPNGTWVATDEMRPLNYLNADTPTLWDVATKVGTKYSFTERFRISQELAAATWIRNAHSIYQLREFMVDFWHNHFNIGKNENALATALLPVYDRVAIRPHALGNFRAMLEANATSSSMLQYLDNWVSTATTPNENYAREIMELHTLGGGAYLGTVDPITVAKDPNTGVAVGFTDQDIIMASRALSGWTIQAGQRFGNVTLPSTGEFIYNAAQHNQLAGHLLGINVLGNTTPMAQGRTLLDAIAYHPATANFIVTKLAKRIFGDTPPAAVVARGVSAWMGSQNAFDQVARVLRAMLLDGNEVFDAPVAKVRRPYERIIAMFRTTDTILRASQVATSILDPLNDMLFAWPAPDGRPDVNAYWLATGSTIATWNLLLTLLYSTELTTSLTAQTPVGTGNAATPLVEYWVGRMVGARLSDAAMNALTVDQSGFNGVPNVLRFNNANSTENAYRRLVALIATTEDFSYR